ncbi:pleckstrin homology domain-containing family O member 1b [Antennarius striatus]|uniref:pleckstrin homology domain-containing family O member 1b n=1 Tax=Antennarius striatus TaxID=241820 RepID=UPI0035B4A948
MRRNSSGKRGPQDTALQPDKSGWIRKFCGRGVFREIWKNRFLVLRGDQLFICETEVKEPGEADEVLDLLDYQDCEEMRKNNSRSKKNHSRFKLEGAAESQVQTLVFLAVSPEDKESWIGVLNGAISRAKNRVLDEVLVDESQLVHPTRHRPKIPHNRRPPSRGHLLASSSSDGTLILDLIQEEGPPSPQAVHHCEAFKVNQDTPLSNCPVSTDSSLSVKTTGADGKSQRTQPTVVEENTDETLKQLRTTAAPGSGSGTSTLPVSRLQHLIYQKLERTERLLVEVRLEADGDQREVNNLTEGARPEAERLLKEAAAAWNQAQEVLEEVKELLVLSQQLDRSNPSAPAATPN